MLESDLAALLEELIGIQDELLALLVGKQRLLLTGDVAGLDELAPREAALLAKLDGMRSRRAELLSQAASAGAPALSLRCASEILPREERVRLAPSFDAAAQRSRMLEHQCLANWVLAQRTIVHLSQLLEIIATGGRERPTYEVGPSAFTGGGLVDEAA